jgi:hypothetical protein
MPLVWLLSLIVNQDMLISTTILMIKCRVLRARHVFLAVLTGFPRTLRQSHWLLIGELDSKEEAVLVFVSGIVACTF